MTEAELIEKAKAILAEADDGSELVQQYNNGYLDGISFAWRQSLQYHVVRSANANMFQLISIAEDGSMVFKFNPVVR